MSITLLEPGAVVATRWASLDQVPVVVGPLPPATDPDALFYHHPTDPALARLSTRVPATAVGVTVEVVDPAGRTTRASWRAP